MRSEVGEMQCRLARRIRAAADKPAVLSALAHTQADVHQRYAEGLALVETWLDGDAPFPERLHISALVAVFTRDLLWLMIQWSEFASARSSGGREPTAWA